MLTEWVCRCFRLWGENQVLEIDSRFLYRGEERKQESAGGPPSRVLHQILFSFVITPRYWSTYLFLCTVARTEWNRDKLRRWVRETNPQVKFQVGVVAPWMIREDRKRGGKPSRPHLERVRGELPSVLPRHGRRRCSARLPLSLSLSPVFSLSPPQGHDTKVCPAFLRVVVEVNQWRRLTVSLSLSLFIFHWLSTHFRCCFGAG